MYSTETVLVNDLQGLELKLSTYTLLFYNVVSLVFVSVCLVCFHLLECNHFWYVIVEDRRKE